VKKFISYGLARFWHLTGTCGGVPTTKNLKSKRGSGPDRTLVGNTIGGVALVAFLNHAPLVSELQEEVDEKNGRENHGAALSTNRATLSRAKRRK